MKRRAILHIHTPQEHKPFPFLEAEYGVYQDRPLEWANEHYIKKHFPAKGGITEEEKNKIKSFFEERRKEFPEGTSALLPVLNDIKRTWGVVYQEFMEYVASLFGVSPSFVLGTATFYTMLEGFDGKPEVYVCMSLPCAIQGAEKIYKKMREEGEKEGVEVRRWVCLGRCEYAPVVHIPYTPKSFGYVKEEDTQKILQVAKEVCPWKKSG